MALYTNLTDLIGNTPLYQMPKPDPDFYGDVFVKLEMFNITGSIKDRIALNMIEKAEERGKLKSGMTIEDNSRGYFR